MTTDRTGQNHWADGAGVRRDASSAGVGISNGDQAVTVQRDPRSGEVRFGMVARDRDALGGQWGAWHGDGQSRRGRCWEQKTDRRAAFTHDVTTYSWSNGELWQPVGTAFATDAPTDRTQP